MFSYPPNADLYDCNAQGARDIRDTRELVQLDANESNQAAGRRLRLVTDDTQRASVETTGDEGLPRLCIGLP